MFLDQKTVLVVRLRGQGSDHECLVVSERLQKHRLAVLSVWERCLDLDQLTSPELCLVEVE